MSDEYCHHSGKVKFKTRGKAQARIGRIKSQGGLRRNLTTYLCGHCGTYHLTKSRGNDRYKKRSKAERRAMRDNADHPCV